MQIFSEILNSLELDVETSSLWLPYTLTIIINHSIELPTVSSFYKILTIIFQELDWYTLLRNIKNNRAQEKILEYINYVLGYVHTFKADLQLCCLEMIMSLPSFIVKEIFNDQILDTVKVIIILLICMVTLYYMCLKYLFLFLKTALAVGSTNLPLAKCAVNALKRWKLDLSKNEMDHLLKLTMPFLDLLLRTKGLTFIIVLFTYS